MTSWNGLRKLPTLIFGKTQKPLWVKDTINPLQLFVENANFSVKTTYDF